MFDEGQPELFAQLFAGNPAAHYVRHADGRYEAVERGITVEDVARHLRGEWPSLLSIPILPDGRCRFAALDVDRHRDEDPPVDHAALAQQIADLHLPLVVCRSKNPKGAHLWLFFKDQDGFSADLTRRLFTRYQHILNLTGEVEIFPKQGVLTPGQKGNGINLPYHGAERPASGPRGSLPLAEFLALAADRRVFGTILVDRDLATEAPGPAPRTDVDRPLPIKIIRELHRKNLEALRRASPGARNTTFNTAVFFAARAAAAQALEETPDKIQQDIIGIARELGMAQHEVDATLRSAWGAGSAQPFLILNTQQNHDDALARITGLLTDENLPILDIEAVVRDAALLVPLEYGPLRRPLADRLNIKADLLDVEVDKRRERDEGDKQGTTIEITDVEPWGETVNGAAMLGEVEAIFRRYVFFPNPGDPTVLAAWTVYTHAYDLFRVSPYLGITSPEKECGKTTLLEILAELTRRALLASNFTSASIFRAVDLFKPTLLIDELDTFLAQSTELIGILNSGHKKKAAHVCRCVGDDNELRKFSTWGPKAYGMIGKPTGTLVSRSIVIHLLRKNDDEPVEKLPRELPPEFNRLLRQAARWTRDHSDEISRCRPDLSNLNNRAADNWEPLLVVAAVAGESWLERISKAIFNRMADKADEDEDVRIQLLRDVQNIFHTRRVTFIPAELLIRDLLRQSESPWQRYDRGQELNRYNLRLLLQDLGVQSKLSRVTRELIKEIRDPSKTVQRGYEIGQFQDLFTRFLRDEEPRAVDVSLGNEII